jgi:hypothetical protein
MEMQPNGTMSVLFYTTERVWPDIPCTVRISGERILVEYKEKDGTPASYEGLEEGVGHFKLEATSAHISGTATLHRLPSAPEILEGRWHESRNVRRGKSEDGMWIIKLHEPAEW